MNFSLKVAITSGWPLFTCSFQGDLGGIDAKYDVAISTTCPALDNIVVDCSETAVKCINFLRQGNHGVATFIDLGRQEKLRTRMANKPKTYGSSRLMTLIGAMFTVHSLLSLLPTLTMNF